MASFAIRDLLEAGFHFGHPVSRWNPKMKPYIFGKRNLIHMIDLRETVRGLVIARRFVEAVCGEGKDVLFVGTKHQAKNSVKNQALRSGMHYVNERWLGGTLTNFRTIRSRLSRLQELEDLEKTGEMDQFSKKMIATLTREKTKIHQNLEGIRNMERLPGVLIVVDPHKEKNAVAEAKKLKIPIVALTDTDCDPTLVDVVVPGNDDAMRAIEIVCGTAADAALSGKAKAPAIPVKAVEPADAPEEAEPKREERGRQQRGRGRGRGRRQREETEERVRVRRRVAVPQPGEEEAKPEEGAEAATEGEQPPSTETAAEVKPEQPPAEAEAKPEPAEPQQAEQPAEGQDAPPTEAGEPAAPAEEKQEETSPPAEEQAKEDH